MDKISRRDVLARGGAFGVAVLGGSACGKPRRIALSCGDTSGLSDADLQVRTALQYQDESQDPARKCDLCLQFLPPPEGARACGACKVVKGPIDPHGSCKSFASKPTV
jgi:hypothetical protein